MTNIQVAEAAGTITGTVYRDYNGNGTQDTGEIGEAGVIARAYDSSDALVGTATSIANGTYSLAHTGNGTIRVEFTIPASACNLASTVDFPSTGGATYGTSVQFVAATQANVNFAFNNPAEFNNLVNVVNPPLAITQFVPGDPLLNTGAATDARLGAAFNTFAYNSAGQIGSTGYTPVLGTAPAAQIGSAWGLAYQKETGSVFASAVTKRHAGFGSLGSGGIYRITSTGATSFVNVNTIGIPTGTVTRTATGVNGLPANRNGVSTDADSFDKVGKTGIGGLDLSDDGRFLYLMNLFDDPATTTVNERRLYRLEIGNPAAVPTAANVTAYDLPNPNCVRGVARPWAVKYYRGSVYTGIVCSGENAGTNTVNGASDINAFVYQMDATTGVFNTTPILTIPLNYQKGTAFNEPVANRKWNPWTATFQSSGNGSIFPQPILSDLEFDKDGTLILGLMDRNGMQTGFFQPNTAGAGQIEGFSSGDLLRAYKNPTGCAFQLESNAREGAASAKAATAGAGNNQGPGGGEFYYQESLAGTHEETSLGSLAFLPNNAGNDVTVGVYDPTRIRSGGVSWMDNTTGATDRDYEIYFEAQSGSTNTQGSFGKSVGLGDIEPLLAPAPLEIGNRVWNDADRDGIQDPNETVISGVSLELYADFNDDGTPDGAVLATTTTSASGNWYFNNANIADGEPTVAGNQAGLQPNRNYLVRIAASQFTGSRGVAATPLAGLTLTPNDRTGNGAVDLSDSDAIYNGGFAQIRVPAMVSGRSTHSFDFGLAVPVYSVGNRVFNDTNNNGIRETAETGISAATVNLYLDANNDNVADGVAIATTTTDASGYYRFDNLAANNYIVGVAIPTGFASSSVNAADPDNNVDNDDSGITVAGAEIRSFAVTLGDQAEPINETDLSASGQGNFDNQANLTLDFGFFQTASIGDLVFNDTDRDGVQDAGELGVGGVTVVLTGTTTNGVAVNLTTTTATTGTIGSYVFAGLAPGSYTVTVTQPTGFRFSPQDAGGNDALDSDVNASGATASIAVTAGQVITNVDAGLVPVVSIGNQVFNDVNNNG
ncbi:MAG: hypothetical protein H7Z37_16565, partial [Pyrinomonadaceae bacterium]|nr:hypothetical protein [Pyrinomonadaceae bacterium]